MDYATMFLTACVITCVIAWASGRECAQKAALLLGAACVAANTIFNNMHPPELVAANVALDAMVMTILYFIMHRHPFRRYVYLSIYTAMMCGHVVALIVRPADFYGYYLLQNVLFGVALAVTNGFAGVGIVHRIRALWPDIRRVAFAKAGRK